jgi:hypothetical protein
MARFFKTTILLLGILLASCQEGREAGDLLGQWRMTGSDTKYVSFSGTFVKFAILNRGEVFGNFQHVGDSLYIKCYSIEATPSDTSLVEGDYGLAPFDNIRLKIETLNGDELILSKGNRIISFYKY